jgi:hypothetical protein
LTDVTINSTCATLLLASYNGQWSNSNAFGDATFKAHGNISCQTADCRIHVEQP